MLKPKRLQTPTNAIMQPIPTFRPRLVLAHDDGSRSDAPTGGTPRVLIVEDDYLISEDLEAELTAAGFEVIGVARSASHAVGLAIEKKPHLVIMDIRLEGQRDGVEAAIDIFRSCGVRSLFASAHHNAETRLRAEACSPLGWVAKPYTMGSLVGAVRAALRNLGHYEDKS